VWQGTLPKKNLTLKQSRHLLTTNETTYSFLDRSVSQSHYYERALQGATLNPHTLWFVEVDQSVPLNVSHPLVKTSEEAFALCKEEKWKLHVSGRVEKEFLFVTALSDNILPFAVRGLTLTVLPVMVDEKRLAMMTHDDILSRGFEAASDWVKQAEELFIERIKDRKTTAQEYLNYQQKLTSQLPKVPYIVLYNKSGTNICAALLKREQYEHFGDLEVSAFVAESVTYRIYTDTEDEGLYLIGVLNSTVVNDAIKPYQTEGVYHGKRDIHRRPFEICPIEVYDSNNALHQQIVALSKLAREKVSKWAGQLEGTLAKVREQSRDIIRNEIDQIDVLVAKTLKLNPIKSGPRNRKGSHQESMFDVVAES
jgi:hypothetical protein